MCFSLLPENPVRPDRLAHVRARDLVVVPADDDVHGVSSRQVLNRRLEFAKIQVDAHLGKEQQTDAERRGSAYDALDLALQQRHAGRGQAQQAARARSEDVVGLANLREADPIVSNLHRVSDVVVEDFVPPRRARRRRCGGGHLAPAKARDEALDEIGDGFPVAEPWTVDVALEEHQARTGDLRGELDSEPARDRAISAPVNHERRHADPR
jgi:hypothetical protein